MKRATMADFARVAGVGIATVDRVLNNRVPVSEGRALRVLEAVERVNYHAQGLLRRRIEEMAPARTLAGICPAKRGKMVLPDAWRRSQ